MTLAPDIKPPIPPEAVRAQLEKILASQVFSNAGRSGRLLRFLVDETILGRGERLKEYTLGAEALGRGASFDPRTDPIARVEASRLRAKLDQYYAADGRSDALLIALPKGSYLPRFENRPVEPDRVTSHPAPSRRLGPGRLGPLSWFAMGGATAGCAVGLAAWALWPARTSTQPALVRLEVELRSAGSLGSEVGPDVALSPDGARLVFVAYDSANTPRLYTRRFDQPDATELPGTAGARVPFFSPDGRSVAFWASGQLKKIAIAGAAPIVLCDAADLLGGSWGDDGNIIAALNTGTGNLWRVPAAGGGSSKITDLVPGSPMAAWPQALPGAKAILFTARGSAAADGSNVELLTLNDGHRRTLVRGGTYARYLPTGHLIYVNGGRLFATRFDLRRLETIGAPVMLLEDVAYSPTFGYAQFDVSAAGTFVYRRTSASGRLTVQWLDDSGNLEPLLPRPASYLWPRFSPDGQRLAIGVIENGVTNIWIHEHPKDRMTRLTTASAAAPLWTPDGRYVIAEDEQGRGLSWLPADGASEPEHLAGSSRAVPWSFTPDGKRLAFYEMSSTTAFDLWTVPIAADERGLRGGRPEVFLQTPAYEVYPAISPDGRWLAYSSNESGSWEVYVRAFPDNGRKTQVSSGGGRVPRWSPKGSHLFFSTDDQRMMRASYAVHGASFVADQPRLWWDGRLADTGVLPNFDVAPDGRRLAVLIPPADPTAQQTPNHVTFLFNFFDEVQRRLSVGHQ